jgi:hypothetical protein
MPGCDQPASCKIAASWAYGHFTELKTYGFACSGHEGPMIRFGEGRFKPPHLAEGESLGPVTSVPLERQPD